MPAQMRHDGNSFRGVASKVLLGETKLDSAANCSPTARSGE